MSELNIYNIILNDTITLRCYIFIVCCQGVRTEEDLEEKHQKEMTEIKENHRKQIIDLGGFIARGLSWNFAELRCNIILRSNHRLFFFIFFLFF